MIHGTTAYVPSHRFHGNFSSSRSVRKQRSPSTQDGPLRRHDEDKAFGMSVQTSGEPSAYCTTSCIARYRIVSIIGRLRSSWYHEKQCFWLLAMWRITYLLHRTMSFSSTSPYATVRSGSDAGSQCRVHLATLLIPLSCIDAVIQKHFRQFIHFLNRSD